MPKQNYYVLFTKRGALAVTDYKLPIYWYRRVAEKEAEKYGFTVKPVNIFELEFLLKSK